MWRHVSESEPTDPGESLARPYGTPDRESRLARASEGRKLKMDRQPVQSLQGGDEDSFLVDLVARTL
ncbi:MAG: hypothetical protein JWQ70_941 [Aeromicrobium sp.]|nr:hypothetical protein [Aeromicrobium sp.]